MMAAPVMPCCSPRGERGLKHCIRDNAVDDPQLLPTRGAGVEKRIWYLHTRAHKVAPHAASIETSRCSQRELRPASLPTRGAWIETCRRICSTGSTAVAPHAGERGLKPDWVIAR